MPLHENKKYESCVHRNWNQHQFIQRFSYFYILVTIWMASPRFLWCYEQQIEGTCTEKLIVINFMDRNEKPGYPLPSSPIICSLYCLNWKIYIMWRAKIVEIWSVWGVQLCLCYEHKIENCLRYSTMQVFNSNLGNHMSGKL